MRSREREPLPPPYKAPPAVDPYQALDIAQKDLRTARRRITKWAERTRRWQALLADPAEMTRRSPADTRAGLENAIRYAREWTRRASEVQRVITRLKRRTRVTYCESEDYRQRVRAAAQATFPADGSGGPREVLRSPSAGTMLDPVGRLRKRP
jgi:hypothetical protein